MGFLIGCHIIVSDLQAIKTVEEENQAEREGRCSAGGRLGRVRGEGLRAGVDRSTEGLY